MTPRRGKLDEAYFTGCLKAFGVMALFAGAAGVVYTFVWPIVCGVTAGCGVASW